MRQFIVAVALLAASMAYADDYQPLDPSEKALSEITNKYFQSCPPRDDENSFQWNERCVPKAIRDARKKIRVVDGDTLEFEGEIIRLANIDAPETHRAKCQAEKLLGEQAAGYLETMLSNLKIKRIGKDKYGRTLAYLQMLDRVDVGETLVRIGVAVPYSGGKRHNWCE